MGSGTPEIVVVPRRPGTVIHLPSEPAPREVDVLLDGLFGEPTTVRAGMFDVALVVGGAGLVAVAAAADPAGGLDFIGLAMIALGLVLPVRDLGHRIQRRHRAGRTTEVLREGLPLDVSHPSSRRLVELYGRLQQDADATALGADALEAAHLALTEVADLLRGRAPGGAEVAYVSARGDALQTLQNALDAERSGRTGAAVDEDSQVRDATVTAICALEESTGGSSLDRMQALRTVLERGT